MMWGRPQIGQSHPFVNGIANNPNGNRALSSGCSNWWELCLFREVKSDSDAVHYISDCWEWLADYTQDLIVFTWRTSWWRSKAGSSYLLTIVEWCELHPILLTIRCWIIVVLATCRRASDPSLPPADQIPRQCLSNVPPDLLQTSFRMCSLIQRSDGPEPSGRYDSDFEIPSGLLDSWCWNVVSSSYEWRG